MSPLPARRWLVAMVLAVLLATGLTMTAASPVFADHGCIVARWPAFKNIAPTARRVVVGTVTESLSPAHPDLRAWQYGLTDPSDKFRLRVDEVLRGAAPEIIEVRRLRSGLPLRDKRPGCRYLTAKVGDRIAIAYRGRLKGATGRYTTVAWIEGRPGISGEPAERLSLGRIRSLSGHEPDGSTLPRGRGIRRPSVSFAGLAGILERAIGETVRSIGDAGAVGVCSSILEALPEIEVRKPATLVAAYRMGGPELAAYSERLWSLGPTVDEASDGFTRGLDVCIFDGSFTASRSDRVLVLVDDDGPAEWGAVRCDKNEVPLDYDRAPPLSWPEPAHNSC